VARNEVLIDAPPAAVFALLSDAHRYPAWVVGARTVRSAEADWPAPGSAFHHTVGHPPLVLRDRTEVLDAEPPVMLRLRARARPLPSATITVHLQPEGAGTRLTMIEAPASGALSLLAGPLGHALLALRNRESLRRLKVLAEDAAHRG
jgi:uncharacterized protein YndB with AHSA1/START domain